MINLLPPQSKEDVLYARRNATLVKWIVAVIIAAMGSLVIIGFGQIYLSQTAKTYQKQIEDGQAQLKIQKLEETQARVNELSGNLKLVVQVLSKNILFSKVLKQVGAAIPSGAVLTDLTINKVQGGIDLTFEAKDYQTGSQIVLNLQDPKNKVFEKADIEEISCDSELQSNRTYLCQVSIRALFGDNSPFLFINNGASR
jgi:Tfp pilus assembly protein PilN